MLKSEELSTSKRATSAVCRCAAATAASAASSRHGAARSGGATRGTPWVGGWLMDTDQGAEAESCRDTCWDTHRDPRCGGGPAANLGEGPIGS